MLSLLVTFLCVALEARERKAFDGLRRVEEDFVGLGLLHLEIG